LGAFAHGFKRPHSPGAQPQRSFKARSRRKRRHCRRTKKTSDTAFSTDFLIKKHIEMIRELGHFPLEGELRIKRQQDKTFWAEGQPTGG
jgi:hypothetical protein